MEQKIIWIDTRQKPKQWDWLKDEFIEKGFKIKNDKPMTYGDYCMPPNLSVLVDTKFAIQEIIGNVIQQHTRFTRELQGAYDMGAKLYILILDEKVKCLDDLETWENPRIKVWAIQKARAKRTGKPYRTQPPTSGSMLRKILKTMEEKYHTKFIFCNKKDCCNTIIKLLEEKEF